MFVAAYNLTGSSAVRRTWWPYVTTLGAVGVSLLVVGLLQTTILDPQAALLVYLVPVVLAASRWAGAPLFSRSSCRCLAMTCCSSIRAAA